MNVDITVVHPGENPRRYMDPEELTELTKSIKELGVIQPITVKAQSDGQYIIVAGHRRHKAAVAAGLTDIPVFVLDDEKDSDTVALVENVIRADMSPAEECDRAMLLLKKNKGDITEVSLATGWSEDKIRRRVALASCSQPVRDALAMRKIKLGIAELLASVPEAENQNKALEKIIAMNLGVEQVRQYLFRLVQKLDNAIFDKSECSQCRFNTSLQSTLFSETVAEDAYCTNGNCYSKKTDDAVVKKADEIKETYPNVRIIRLGDPENYTRLVSDGKTGVGSKQSKKCRSCANFGATVSCLPGAEGQIADSICFDLTCNAKMVSVHQAETSTSEMTHATVSAPSTQPRVEAAPSLCGAEGDSGCDETDLGASDNVENDLPTTAPVHRPAVTMTNAVKEYRRTLWNRAAMVGLAHNTEAAQAVLAAIIIKGKSGSSLYGTDVAKVLSKNATSMDQSAINQSDIGALALFVQSKKLDRKLLSAASAFAMSHLDEADVRSILTFLGVDISEIWQIDADYLSILTKSEITSVADELGISEKVPDWKKVSNGKKAELILAIMASGVDFKGLLPSSLQY